MSLAMQAARVTREGGRLKNIVTSIRARPFQYAKTPQSELDSFLLYAQAVHLRVCVWSAQADPMRVVTLLSFFVHRRNYLGSPSSHGWYIRHF